MVNQIAADETRLRSPVIQREQKAYLRGLAKRVAEIAADPAQEFRRRVWYAQNSLHPIKPPVFCFPWMCWSELSATGSQLAHPLLQAWERDLLTRIYAWEHFQDDQVTDDVIYVKHVFVDTGWGLSAARTQVASEGSYIWDPPLKDPADLDKLHFPEVVVDWETTQAHLDLAKEVFGDLLRVELRTEFWWTLGIMYEWAQLRGLVQLMMDMVDRPAWMHEASQFMAAGRLHFLDNLEAQGLLSLNNGCHQLGCRSFGFTDELPSTDYTEGRTMTRDMWGFTESQETTGIGPGMLWDFVLQYEAPIHERFGLTCYGCCEPLDRKFDVVKRLPNLRRVAVSPWCDRAVAAEALTDEYCYAWRPNPAYLAGPTFDPEFIRADIRRTFELARGSHIEIELKDCQTCSGEPWRFDEWARIAQEESLRVAEQL
ncbi:MAG: hypothetical protein GX620_10725 [Chloroflexi bacterium]|nr:hypothetical protein [Chloroflexota bacterium]